jgi:outer membrane lipoprotein-sorting protein
MILEFFFFVGVALLGITGCAAGRPTEPDQAQAAVVEAWQAPQHIVWEIDWPAAPVGGPLTVESWRAGDRYRFEILESTAPDLIGQTLVFNGKRAWRYNRFESVSPESTAAARLSPVTDAVAVIEQFVAKTPHAATRQPDSLLDAGPVQKIALNFDNDNSLTAWIDEETGLPIRLQFLENGRQAILQARDFEPLPDPPSGLFEVAWRE